MPNKDIKKNFEDLIGRVEHLILTGVLRPSQRLVEADLSDMLNVSRYWIRDALKILEGKGLVEIVPYKGAQVVDLNQKQIEDVHVIRVQLERLAINLALSRIQPADIEDLRNVAELIEESYQKNDTERMVKYDTQFHDSIFKIADNPTLLQLIVDMRTRLHITRYASWASSQTLKKILKEHLLFIEAFQKKDIQRLESLLERHISYSKDYYIAQLDRVQAKIREHA